MHSLSGLLFCWKSGLLPIDIRAIISNHRDLHQLPASDNIAFHHTPVSAATKVELIVLARYMQILSEPMCHVLAHAVKWHSEHRMLLNGHKTVIFK